MDTTRSTTTRSRLRLYIGSILVVALCTATGIMLRSILSPIDQVMLYLIGVVFVAARLGRGPSIVSSFLSVTCFNFFFVEPLYTFSVYDSSYWMTFLVMLATSLVITTQASQLRLQSFLSQKRERHTEILYTLTRALASTRGYKNISEGTAQHITTLFKADVTIWLPDDNHHLTVMVGALPEGDVIKEMGVLQWCYDNGQPAGCSTNTMPSAQGLYLPLIATNGTLGVLGIISKNTGRHFSLEETSLLEAFANLLASALERENAAAIAEKSKIEMESEKLRNILLSSVSHDLRTPLASIAGASTSIAMDGNTLPRETLCDLGSSIYREANRLSRLVTNLLNITIIETGAIKLNLQPYFIEEIIGSVLSQLEALLCQHTITINVPKALPVVMMDAILIEQVLINLLENAVKYTPEGSSITLRITHNSEEVMVSIADNGPGIIIGDEQKVFDKFYTRGQKGTGLGLAICHGVITAHKGRILAENKPEGGAIFSFTLPIVHLDRKQEPNEPTE